METTELHTTRNAETVEIDAQAAPTDDGRVHVRIVSIVDGVIAAEPWYEDTLDEVSAADLETLADEAVAAFVA